ncbi:MAG: hypothetical protein EHM91_15860 [Planctomycetota bacterium]|nr:MAG: hypothetical protein EHM91_15860 [Planctomycetota bacterium]
MSPEPFFSQEDDVHFRAWAEPVARFNRLDTFGPRERNWYRRFYRELRVRLHEDPDFYVHHPEARYEGHSFGMYRQQAKQFVWMVVIEHEWRRYMASK